MVDPERFNRSGENKIGLSSRKALILGIMEEKPMHEWESLSHVRWDCKYHVILVPKYRKRVLYGKVKRDLGEILKDLAKQKRIDFVEGDLMPDHVHMCLKIPPK